MRQSSDIPVGRRPVLVCRGSREGLVVSGLVRVMHAEDFRGAALELARLGSVL